MTSGPSWQGLPETENVQICWFPRTGVYPLCGWPTDGCTFVLGNACPYTPLYRSVRGVSDWNPDLILGLHRVG